MEWRQNSCDRAAVPMLIMKNLHPVCGSEVYFQAAFKLERLGLAPVVRGERVGWGKAPPMAVKMRQKFCGGVGGGEGLSPE